MGVVGRTGKGLAGLSKGLEKGAQRGDYNRLGSRVYYNSVSAVCLYSLAGTARKGVIL